MPTRRYSQIFALAASVFALTMFAMSRKVQLRETIPIDPQLHAPPNVESLIRRSCADCHSSGSRLPWYGRIPPGSWILADEVGRARQAMDLSQWAAKNGRRAGIAVATLAAACADVQSGRMPRPPYLLLHSEARLDAEDVNRFCAWTRSEAERLNIARQLHKNR